MRTSEFKQSEPGGLYLPMHATLKGRVRWQVLDERGVPEVPRTPSGIPVGPVEGVEQDNLITDLGMDRIGTVIVFSENAAVESLRNYLAVGTGSAIPDENDTTLDNEAQRANSAGLFPAGSHLGSLDTINDLWKCESKVTRVVTMSADRNLTEFGFSNASSANIVIRELLRDGGGNPITVSLLNGKSLRVDHTLEVTLPAPAAGISSVISVDEYDAGNNFIGGTPYDVIYGMEAPSFNASYIANGNNNATIMSIFGVWQPAGSSTGVRRLTTAAKSYARGGSGLSGGDLEPRISVTSSLVPQSLQAYTPGSYERRKRYTVATGAANAPWYGYHIGGTYTPLAGYMTVRFDDPATYTKQNTDTLRVGLVSTWARA